MNIERDAPVDASDGEVGRVRHVVVHARTGEVTDLVVGDGDREWLVPIRDVSGAEDGRVCLSLTRAEVMSLPPFRRDALGGTDEGRGDTTAGAPLTAAGPDAVSAGRRTAAASLPSAPAATGAGSDEQYRLELKEERLRIVREPEEVGAVRVTKRVVERMESVGVPVREEVLVIEQVPGRGVVRIGDRELGDGESVELVIYRERAVPHKEVVVGEDVSIHKRSVERTVRVNEQLRREQIVVEDPGGFVVRGPQQMRGDGAGNQMPHRPGDQLSDADTEAAGQPAGAGPLDPNWEAAGTAIIGRRPIEYTYPSSGAGGEGMLVEGAPVVSADGDALGTVGAVVGDRFKVNAPMARDFWLSRDSITGIAPGGDLVVSAAHDNLDQIKVAPPEHAGS